MDIKAFIENECITPGFPVDGVNFVDIFPVIEKTYKEDFPKLAELAGDMALVILPEARGFLYYGALGADKCMPVRKGGKLPGEVVGITYMKEYGPDTVYYQTAALERILNRNLEGRDLSGMEYIPVMIFDDILATGGTAAAIVKHFNSLSFHGVPLKVVRAAFHLELSTELPFGRKAVEDLGTEVVALHSY